MLPQRGLSASRWLSRSPLPPRFRPGSGVEGGGAIDPGTRGPSPGGPGRRSCGERTTRRPPPEIRRAPAAIAAPRRCQPHRPLARGRPAAGQGIDQHLEQGLEALRGPRRPGPGMPGSRRPGRKSAAEFLALAKQRRRRQSRRTMPWPGSALREVLERQPDQPEARRLLGYVPHDGGWARPFAVASSSKGSSTIRSSAGSPPTGCLTSMRGELPAPGVRVPGEGPAGSPPTRPTGCARTGRTPGRSPPSTSRSRPTSRSPRPSSSRGRLEAFYDLFFALHGRRGRRDAARWPGGSAPRHSTAEASYRPHQVYYFATKEEYVEHLRSLGRRGHRPEPGLLQPAPARQGQPRPGLLLPRPRRPAPRHGDALPRGLAPAPLRDGRTQRLHAETRAITGSSRGWGPTSRPSRPRPTARSRSAAWSASGSRRPSGRSRPAGSCPSSQFVRLDQNGFNRADRIHVNYQQAMAPDRLPDAGTTTRPTATPSSTTCATRTEAGSSSAPAGRWKTGSASRSKALEAQFREFLRPSARERQGISDEGGARAGQCSVLPARSYALA